MGRVILLVASARRCPAVRVNGRGVLRVRVGSASLCLFDLTAPRTHPATVDMCEGLSCFGANKMHAASL